MEELHCNIVAMRRSRPKVLRLYLAGSPEKKSKSPASAGKSKAADDVKDQRSSIRVAALTRKHLSKPPMLGRPLSQAPILPLLHFVFQKIPMAP
jgi:hypothetical protein